MVACDSRDWKKNWLIILVAKTIYFLNFDLNKFFSDLIFLSSCIGFLKNRNNQNYRFH